MLTRFFVCNGSEDINVDCTIVMPDGDEIICRESELYINVSNALCMGIGFILENGVVPNATLLSLKLTNPHTLVELREHRLEIVAVMGPGKR